MSGEAHDGDTLAVESTDLVRDGGSGNTEAEKSPAQDIESRIMAALRARDSFWREKSDSFTFESVRRLLEEDLGLSKYSLDGHRSFIKLHLVQCLEGTSDENRSKNSQETKKKDVSESKEANEAPRGNKLKKDSKEDDSKDERMEDSPIMGLLTVEKKAKTEAEEDGGKDIPKIRIKKALMKRASYIHANSEKITMSSLRRLLEKDLKLDKFALDPYKKLVSKLLDEVLQSQEPKRAEAKGKDSKKRPRSKASTKKSDEEISDGSDGNDDNEEEEEESKSEKKIGKKRKLQKSEGLKKKQSKEAEVSAKKKRKPSEKEDKRDEGGSDVSDDDRPHSSADKCAKKKETSTPISGKRVEHLKSVIKSCGMSVYPSIYRKVKQASEEKREAYLIRELEQILAKEGLSPNPSEKEIKEVRKRKEREKELEGIDTSNIVTSSRRRSAASFAPPPKPKVSEEIESEDTEDSDDDDDDDVDDDEEAEEEQPEDQEDNAEEANEEQGDNQEDEDEEGNEESRSKEVDDGNDESNEEGRSKEKIDGKKEVREDKPSKELNDEDGKDEE